MLQVNLPVPGTLFHLQSNKFAMGVRTTAMDDSKLNDSPVWFYTTASALAKFCTIFYHMHCTTRKVLFTLKISTCSKILA